MMKLSALVDTDREVPIEIGMWAYAMLLAKARVKSNDARRAKRRDRGEKKNLEGDLRGAFCELFLFKEVIAQAAEDGVDHMRHHLFNPAGGGEEAGPDLQCAEGARQVCLDVKSFDCDPGKRYFAINADKHHKLRGCCDYYLCLLVAPLGPKAFVAKLVPYAAVDRWPMGELGRYGDASCNLPIVDFISSYAPGADIAALWTPAARYTEERVDACAAKPRIREGLTKWLPALAPFLPEPSVSTR